MKALVKAANDGKGVPQNPQAQVRQQQRTTKVQSEIEAFLQSATGQSPPPPPTNQQQQRSANREAEIARRERRKRAEANRQQEELRRQEAQRKSRPSSSRISEHVDQFINQHVEEFIDDDVEEYVEATIVDSVDAHLGKRDEGLETTPKKVSQTAKAVVNLMKQPQGIRNAILVNEVLQRPRVLRK